MADHGQVEYATAAGNDLPEHEAMYDRFVHLAFIGACHATNILLGLAVGAIAGHWLIAFAIFIVASLVAAHGLMSGMRLPSAVMVVLSLIVLALASGG